MEGGQHVAGGIVQQRDTDGSRDPHGIRTERLAGAERQLLRCCERGAGQGFRVAGVSLRSMPRLAHVQLEWAATRRF
jgi:hypothetical protein